MAEGRVWVPETLNALLVDPDDAYIDAWRVQLPAYLDSLAREKNAVYEAVGCGDDFRAYVRVAFEDHTTQRYFVVYGALIWVLCSPAGRKRLHPKDVAYIDDVFRRDLGHFIAGRDRNGQPFSAEERPERLIDAYTATFVKVQAERYAHMYKHAL
jgi:hypothetical protein